MQEKQEYDNRFGIILLGDCMVGKSCLLQSFFGEAPSHDYYGSIGIDYRAKLLKAFNKTIRLSIWDCSGHPSVQILTQTYLRYADGAFICFDLTNMQSLHNTRGFVERLRAIKINAPIFLLGCKADLSERRVVEYAHAKKWADTLGLTYLEVSAFKKVNIEHAFMQITQKLYIPAQLKKYKSVLEENFNEYLKLNPPKNRSGLFATLGQHLSKESTLKEEFRSNLEELFDATSVEEVVGFCIKTLNTIEKVDVFFKRENPFWSQFTLSPLAKALKQTLDFLFSKQLEIFGLSNLRELIFTASCRPGEGRELFKV